MSGSGTWTSASARVSRCQLRMLKTDEVRRANSTSSSASTKARARSVNTFNGRSSMAFSRRVKIVSGLQRQDHLIKLESGTVKRKVGKTLKNARSTRPRPEQLRRSTPIPRLGARRPKCRNGSIGYVVEYGQTAKTKKKQNAFSLFTGQNGLVSLILLDVNERGVGSRRCGGVEEISP